jgi:phosphoribosylaminoimidazole-succinocarboxamide synthase
MNRGETPKQLSKEFFRQWLIQNDFQGKEGQDLPEISNDVVMNVSNRYIELFDKIIGTNFKPRNTNDIISELENNIISAIS